MLNTWSLNTGAELRQLRAALQRALADHSDTDVHNPDGKVSGAVLLPLDEAKRILAASAASRPEIEPVLAYLDGATTSRVWTYRDDQPVD